ncbi:MAG TPA: bile acid:sodium symporter family protein [Methylococcaceae bacterium]|jgi:BASS family bile acid:Na+ symporter|nr:bile acid:sodium symporter family protein [Methylococcaceae bacterium]
MNKIVNLFPVWAILLSVVAYANAAFFASYQQIIVPLLALVMFSMGMTLRWNDFIAVLRKPVIISIAVAIQFLLMPLFAYGLSIYLNLSQELMTGMLLVGASAGGTASNVICYLAKGDVALSILMTIVSTLFAVLLMPALTFLYLNQVVPVPVEGMLKSILLIVLLPVLSGTVINSFFSRRLSKVQAVFPLLSTMAIVLIIAIIVGLNHANLSDLAIPVVLAVCLHNSLGLLFGYGIPRLLKYDERICRTVCIEVAMQNSGLSVALAIKHFSIAAALPGALFSIWHNISGSLLALFWRTKR